MRPYINAVAWTALGLLLCSFLPSARAQSPAVLSLEQGALPYSSLSPEFQQSLLAADDDSPSAGRITGKVVDPVGVPLPGARVTLSFEASTASQEVFSGDDGQFSFSILSTGTFRLAITAPGFADHKLSGILHTSENFAAPRIVLSIASVVTEVRVTPSTIEVAQEQIKQQEKQRALGLIPNFYVTYVHDAAPLTAKQKYELAWKSLIDPVNFGLIGVVAGIQQQQGNFSDFGYGGQGYAKRYGAAFASDATGTVIGSAILPVLLKQDPRYFYKGTGTRRSRLLYAIASAVICKGDNGRWQPNYSAVLGGIAAGGISNFYYPSKDRNGVSLTFENALLGTAATAATNVLQEFLIRKLTPNASAPDPAGKPTKSTNPIAKFWGVLAHDGD